MAKIFILVQAKTLGGCDWIPVFMANGMNTNGVSGLW